MKSWHRFYDPASGRYMTADPIGLRGGINLYAYVRNDPVNRVDPWGLCIWDACIGEAYVATALAGGIFYYGAPLAADAGKWLGNILRNDEEGDEECKDQPAWPGNDPTQAPPGTEWKGKPGSNPGDKEGNYHNPDTGESFHPDLDHGDPIGPHWDYKDPNGDWHRIFPDGRVEPK